MKRLIHTWVMAAALLSSTTSIAAPNDDVDFVTLASQLYRDGHYDRASAVLQSVQPEDLTDQRGDFETLAALLALRQSDFRSAVEHLHGALSAGRTEPAIYVQFAQAYWGLEDWKMVVQSVDNAGEAAANFPELYLMRAQALWRLERKRQALDALVQGSEKFPNNLEFQRQQVYLLLELGLNQTAIEVANAYISRTEPDARDLLALGEGLRRNGDFAQAIHYLEKAHLLFPEDPVVVVQLAQSWVAAGKSSVAADLFQRASDLDPRFVLESAELYRRAGAYERAIYMNSQVADQVAKFRQRIGILIDMERFEDVVALQERSQRLGLLADDSVRYAIAYASFRTGDFLTCQTLLKGISDPQLFKAATQLRSAIARCQSDPFSC